MWRFLVTDAPKATMRLERLLANANAEAARLHHEYISTQHLLLALTTDREGVAVVTLRNLGVDLDDLRSRVQSIVKAGPPDAEPVATRRYTSRTKRVLDLSAAAATAMGHTYLGTQHLLLGLMAEAKNIAAQVLESAGVRPDQARAEIGRLLGPPLHE